MSDDDDVLADILEDELGSPSSKVGRTLSDGPEGSPLARYSPVVDDVEGEGADDQTVDALSSYPVGPSLYDERYSPSEDEDDGYPSSYRGRGEEESPSAPPTGTDVQASLGHFVEPPVDGAPRPPRPRRPARPMLKYNGMPELRVLSMTVNPVGTVGGDQPRPPDAPLLPLPQAAPRPVRILYSLCSIE